MTVMFFPLSNLQYRDKQNSSCTETAELKHKCLLPPFAEEVLRIAGYLFRKCDRGGN